MIPRAPSRAESTNSMTPRASRRSGNHRTASCVPIRSGCFLPRSVPNHHGRRCYRSGGDSRGWIPADPVGLGSSWRIIVSTLRRRSYPTAPVSPLFLFGRMHDLAYQQEVAGSPAQRHHVRLWRCPDGWLLPGGRRVDWLAAGTFDRAVGLSLFTLQVTHRIDADTDIERDHIVATVQPLPGVVVDVIRDFSTGYHSRNGGGDSITTDGDLPILDVRGVSVDAGTRGASREGRP